MLDERDDGLVWVPYPLHHPVRMGREGVSKGECSRNVSCVKSACVRSASVRSACVRMRVRSACVRMRVRSACVRMHVRSESSVRGDCQTENG